MRMNRLVYVLFILLLGATRADTAMIEGVEFKESYTAQEKTLSLRGVALLRYMVFIKAYVGALYLDKNQKADQIFNDVPKRLELHYFHAISAADFAESTRTLIEENLTPQERIRLGPQIAQMNALYRDVKPGDRYAATYLPGVGTELALNGKPLGIVPGVDYAAAYFGIWLGDNPIDKGFRDHLLGKD
ncbi:MAG: hypothetical protein C4518_19785 [Desulfobacteraceae bacterium]|nr:MAG: hypothetical protein C4518_19785 [Desulfobacteraceae bacterium]